MEKSLQLLQLKSMLIIGLLLVPALLLANPIPDAAIFTHVQPADCGQPPAITTCEQITQQSY